MASHRDLDRRQPAANEVLHERRSAGSAGGHGVRGLAEHRLRRPTASRSHLEDQSREVRGCEPERIGEPFRLLEELPRIRSLCQAPQAVQTCPVYSPGQVGVAEQLGARQGTTAPEEEHGSDPREMIHFPPGRDARSPSNFKSPSQNRRNAAQASTSEEIREVRYLNRVLPRQIKRRGDGSRRRQCPRSAHAETLAYGQFVPEAKRELAGSKSE